MRHLRPDSSGMEPRRSEIEPNNVLYMREPPVPSQLEAIQALESILKNQRGFVTVRYVRFVDFHFFLQPSVWPPRIH